LFHQIAENVDFQVRFHWEPNSIAFWDNRVSDCSTFSLDDELKVDLILDCHSHCNL
jgi:hypothetical protein